MSIEFVKRYVLKVLGRPVPIQQPVNEIIGIHSVDGMFCLIADRRIYDDVGQVMNLLYDAKTNTCRPIPEQAPFPPKDLIRYHMANGITLTVCPSLSLRVCICKS